MIKKIIKKTKLYKYFHGLGRNVQGIDKSLEAIKLEQDKIHIELEKIEEKINNVQDDINSVIKCTNEELIMTRQLVNSIDDINNIQGILNEINYKENKLNERTRQFECINTELLMLNHYNERIKILIIGFYGAPNLGDELMLESILKGLSKYNNIEITIMIADNPKYDIRKYGNVNFIHYAKTNVDFHIIAKYFDKIIFGGGALIDDSEWVNERNINTSLYNILINLSICAINQNKEVFLLGLSSALELNNNNYIQSLKYVIENCRYVSLRDRNSLKVLEKYDIDCTNVKVIDDLVYSIPNNDNIVEKSDDSFSVGMVLISYTDTDILVDMINQVKAYMKESTCRTKTIRLIPFYENECCDTNRYKELINYMTADSEIKIEILNYADSYDKIVEYFKLCDMIVAMRYHASLLALKEDIPVIHVIYDTHSHYINKMNELLDNYDAKTNSISLVKYNGDDFFQILKKYHNTKKYDATTNFNMLFESIVK